MPPPDVQHYFIFLYCPALNMLPSLNLIVQTEYGNFTSSGDYKSNWRLKLLISSQFNIDKQSQAIEDLVNANVHHLEIISQTRYLFKKKEIQKYCHDNYGRNSRADVGRDPVVRIGLQKKAMFVFLKTDISKL